MHDGERNLQKYLLKMIVINVLMMMLKMMMMISMMTMIRMMVMMILFEYAKLAALVVRKKQGVNKNFFMGKLR